MFKREFEDKEELMKTNETRSDNAGFSLVEILIVIAIMVVLAGVVSISLIRYVERSRESNCISMRKTMEKEYTTIMIERETLNLDNGVVNYRYTVQDYLDEFTDYVCPDGGDLEPSADGHSIDCTKHGSLY